MLRTRVRSSTNGQRERQEQAARIAAWLHVEGNGRDSSLGAEIVNSSQLPIFDVTVFAIDAFDKIVTLGSVSIVLPAKRPFVVMPDSPVGINDIVGVSPADLGLRFTDFNGVNWIRDPYPYRDLREGKQEFRMSRSSPTSGHDF